MPHSILKIVADFSTAALDIYNTHQLLPKLAKGSSSMKLIDSLLERVNKHSKGSLHGEPNIRGRAHTGRKDEGLEWILP